MAQEATVETPLEVTPFGAPYVLVLAVIHGPDPHASHRIFSTETIVGRSPEADFQIEDLQISKAHFEIEVIGGVYHIKDLDSRNGTEVNGRPLAPGVRTKLKHLDQIAAGQTELLFTASRFRLSD